MDWDAGRVFHSDHNLVPQGEVTVADGEISLSDARGRFREFVRNFRVRNVFVYREQLKQRYHKGEYWLEVNLSDLGAYDSQLQECLQRSPGRFLPSFESGVNDAMAGLLCVTILCNFPVVELSRTHCCRAFIRQ